MPWAGKVKKYLSKVVLSKLKKEAFGFCRPVLCLSTTPNTSGQSNCIRSKDWAGGEVQWSPPLCWDLGIGETREGSLPSSPC